MSSGRKSKRLLTWKAYGQPYYRAPAGRGISVLPPSKPCHVPGDPCQLLFIYFFFSEEGAKLIEEDFPSCSCALASHSFPPRLTSEAARGCETQSKSGSIMAGRRRCSRLEKPCPPRNTALLLSCDTKVEACYQVVT